MPTLAFTIAGQARPAGSKIAVGGGEGTRPRIVDDAGRPGKRWRADVQKVARDAVSRSRHPMGDELPDPAPPWVEGKAPVFLSLTFYVPRPKAHYSRAAGGGLLPTAPELPVTRPDLTKLTRAVEDALTSIVWQDDNQVAGQRVVRLYGTPERVEVAVTVLR